MAQPPGTTLDHGTDMPAVEGVAEPVTGHPVAGFAVRLRARLDALAAPTARPVWAMTTDELRRTLLDLTTAANQLDALRLAVLAEADRIGGVTEAGDRNAADFYARHTHTRRTVARADLRLAHALDDALPMLAVGMASGRVSLDQARSIHRSLDLLPTSGEFAVDSDQRANAEAHLVDLAAHHDASDLDTLGRRIYTVISPETADAYEGRLLEAQEARAARKVHLDSWTDHQGITHGTFKIPRLHGAMLKKALQAIMSPARVVSTSSTNTDGSTSNVLVEPVETNDRRPLPVRRGEAFCELLERMTAHDLPTAGGGDATIVVTIDHQQLLGQLHQAGVATLDTGDRISAAQARHLACRHRILPAVLDGKSVPLDLGRSRRLHTKTQRLAMSTRDGGCTAEHCDTPAAMCHAHHDHPWSEGGTTDVRSGRLLCGPHHRRIHDPTYLHQTLPDGTIRFTRRT